MAKIRKKIDFQDDINTVLEHYKKETEAWKKERLLTIKILLETNSTYEEVALTLSRGSRTVRRWADAFRAGGIQELLNRGNGGGRKGNTTPEIKEAIKQQLKKGEFRTIKQIQKWLEEEFNLILSESCVRYHVTNLGGKLKVPRPSHQKKNEEKVEEFKTTLEEKIKSLEIPKDKELRIWVYDEMRYGLHPILRKMWSLKSHRVIAPVNRRYDWRYLFGAMEVSTGNSEFLYADRVTKDFDRAFIEQISKNDSESFHVIIGDGAGFHHKEGADLETPLPENIHILTLPPYSPELNPMEKFWDVVKDSICTKCWENLDTLEDKITDTLEEWWAKKDKFKSFFKNSYLSVTMNSLIKEN